MKRLATGVLIALSVAVTSVAVGFAFSSTVRTGPDLPQTASDPPKPSRSFQPPPSSDPPGTETIVEDEEKPFVGIAIQTLPLDKAEELGIPGGAVVQRVLPGSPADGKLHTGDVITSIGRTEVTSQEDVVALVREASPGDVLTFTVIRGEETLDVEVTVGERELGVFGRRRHTPDIYHGLLRRLLGLGEKAVRVEIVAEIDGVFKTFRAVSGTLSNIDVQAGTFTLSPKDGSDAISYVVSEDTVIALRHKGDLGGLNTTDATLVIDVDGEVKLVRQGLKVRKHGARPQFHGPGPGLGGRGLGPGPQHRFKRFPDHPRLGEDLQRLVPALPFEGLQEGGLDLRELLKEFEGQFERLYPDLSDGVKGDALGLPM